MTSLNDLISVLDPNEWSALAAWVAILVGAVAATLALLQLRDARRIRREQAAPYVIVKLEPSEASPEIIDFVIENIGSTPAFDIALSVTPDMQRAKEIGAYPFMGAKVFREGIKMLAPGQSVRMYFDSVRERLNADLSSEFEVIVTARDSRRHRVLPGHFSLDIDWGRESVYTSVHNLHWISHRVDRIDKSMRNIADTLRGMRSDTRGPREVELPDAETLERLATLSRRQTGTRGRTHAPGVPDSTDPAVDV
jgi:hypothetical protein